MASSLCVELDKHSSADDASIDAPQLRQLIEGNDELALLDVRETGTFSASHILYSVSLPLSHLEERIAALVPRREVAVVLIDAGDGSGLAERAQVLLRAWGYRNVRVLERGLGSWATAGFQFFSGVYVPNKAFGEYIEHHYHTPSIDAATLQRWSSEAKDFIVLDSRPYDEFQQFSLPGGINCPGGELVYRAFDMVPDPTTTIVINCAGRTRGIIGAQTLINAGIPNPVVTLKNGTAGWHLAGGSLREGATHIAPPPTLAGLKQATAASQRIAERFGVREITAEGFAALKSGPARSVFVLDVRTPEEFAAGHLPGARSAPGGQLIQSTELYVGVQRAVVVLVDDNGVRARFAASWLVQLGWKNVNVLVDGLHASPYLEHGAKTAEVLGGEPGGLTMVSMADARAAIESSEATVLDFDTSLSYKRGHIPGAWFAIRSRIRASLPGVKEGRRIIVTSADGRFAKYAARDLIDAGAQQVEVLIGGTAGWVAAGLPLSSGFQRMADENDDVWYSPYDFDDLGAAMTAYLAWEVGLVEQLEREKVVFLPVAPASGGQV